MTRRLARTFMFFFFNDTATTEIYTLSLHDALPIYTDENYLVSRDVSFQRLADPRPRLLWLHPSPLSYFRLTASGYARASRSEEHTSELQSRLHLVCRLLLEKKKIPPQIL